MTVDSATSKPTKAPQWLYDRVKQLSSSFKASENEDLNLSKKSRIEKGKIVELKLWPSESDSVMSSDDM